MLALSHKRLLCPRQRLLYNIQYIAKNKHISSVQSSNIVFLGTPGWDLHLGPHMLMLMQALSGQEIGRRQEREDVRAIFYQVDKMRALPGHCTYRPTTTIILDVCS